MLRSPLRKLWIFLSTTFFSLFALLGLYAQEGALTKTALLTQESALHAEEKLLIESGYGTGDLLQKFQLAKGQPEQQAAFAQYVQEWNAKHITFHQHTDELTVAQLDFFINQTTPQIELAVAAAKSQLNPQGFFDKKKIAEIDFLAAKLSKKKQAYFDNKNQYGEALDKDRMNAYRDYFKVARGLAEVLVKSVDKKMPVVATPKTDPHSGGFFNGLKSLTLTGSALKTFGAVACHQEGLVDSTPVVEKFEEFYQKYGDNLGYQVQVVGEENIPEYRYRGSAEKTPKTITIFAASHRDEEADAIAITHLGNKKKFPHMIFFAAYNVLPERLAKLVDNTEEILVVGGPDGKDIPKEKIGGLFGAVVRNFKSPLEKLYKNLKSGVASSFVIFPQGSVSIINEVHPPRKKTTWENLVSEGYQVEIVPVSLAVSSRFLSDTADLDDKSVKMTVNPKIDFETYQALVETGGDQQIINRYLRSLWIEQIKENGPLSVSEMDRRIQDKIMAPLNVVFE